jgi:outer membrane protein OmpA-like peptidoglycan-associated protein
LWFEADKSDLQASETSKLSDVAKYLKDNPSLQIGIDATADLSGNDQRRQALQDLSDRRAKAIRNSLIKAGIPAERIQIGAFSDPKLRGERRVQLLFRTAD